MNFNLTYSGQPGFISATLSTQGRTFTKTGFASGRAAKKWAKATAHEHEASLRPKHYKSENKIVSISGSQSFSL